MQSAFVEAQHSVASAPQEEANTLCISRPPEFTELVASVSVTPNAIHQPRAFRMSAAWICWTELSPLPLPASTGDLAVGEVDDQQPWTTGRNDKVAAHFSYRLRRRTPHVEPRAAFITANQVAFRLAIAGFIEGASYVVPRDAYEARKIKIRRTRPAPRWQITNGG